MKGQKNNSSSTLSYLLYNLISSLNYVPGIRHGIPPDLKKTAFRHSSEGGLREWEINYFSSSSSSFLPNISHQNPEPAAMLAANPNPLVR